MVKEFSKVREPPWKPLFNFRLQAVRSVKRQRKMMLTDTERLLLTGICSLNSLESSGGWEGSS